MRRLEERNRNPSGPVPACRAAPLTHVTQGGGRVQAPPPQQRLATRPRSRCWRGVGTSRHLCKLGLDSGPVGLGGQTSSPQLAWLVGEMLKNPWGSGPEHPMDPAPTGAGVRARVAPPSVWQWEAPAPWASPVSALWLDSHHMCSYL